MGLDPVNANFSGVIGLALGALVWFILFLLGAQSLRRGGVAAQQYAPISRSPPGRAAPGWRASAHRAIHSTEVEEPHPVAASSS